MRKPYTYLIGWSHQNTWYYGVRYSATCNTDDLWTSYFTSSDHVKKFTKKHGRPDVIMIRRTFESATLARRWEERVLRRTGAVKSEAWLNKSYGGTTFVGCGGWNKGMPMSDDQKKKLSDVLVGRKIDKAVVEMVAAKNKGLKRTGNALANLQMAQTRKQGIPRSEEVKQRMKEAWEVRRKNHPSRPHSEETKAKMRAAAIARHQSKTINHN